MNVDIKESTALFNKLKTAQGFRGNTITKENLKSICKGAGLPSGNSFLDWLVKYGIVEQTELNMFVLCNEPVYYGKLEIVLTRFRDQNRKYYKTTEEKVVPNTHQYILTEEQAIAFLKSKGYIIYKAV